MPLETPEYMPARPADGHATSDVLEHRPVKGIGFHEDDDGVIFYYDRPLVWVAWFRGEMVVATIVDDDYEGPPGAARGWTQTFLVAVEPDHLMRVYESELHFRDLYDRPGARTWFVHEDWQRTGERAWAHQIRVWDGEPMPDSMKPDPKVYLDSRKKDPEGETAGA